MSAERLQKVLASAGIASRRDCEALIAAGRVTVNGKVVQQPGLRVDPEHDIIMVDGQRVRQPSERTYIMLHKPVGYVSTVDDPQGRPTVLDLVKTPVRVFPVGRLDVDSEGLILLTNDGELAHYLTHPRFEVEKEYRVLLDRPLNSEALRRWRSGVMLNGVPTAPAWVERVETTAEGPWYRIVLHEGRKRQIREVARLLGYEVRRLIRVREGPLALGDLPPRAWRLLTPEEVAALRAHVPTHPPRDERRPVARGDVGVSERKPGGAHAAGNIERSSLRREESLVGRKREERGESSPCRNVAPPQGRQTKHNAGYAENSHRNRRSSPRVGGQSPDFPAARSPSRHAGLSSGRVSRSEERSPLPDEERLLGRAGRSCEGHPAYRNADDRQGSDRAERSPRLRSERSSRHDTHRSTSREDGRFPERSPRRYEEHPPPSKVGAAGVDEEQAFAPQVMPEARKGRGRFGRRTLGTGFRIRSRAPVKTPGGT